MRVAVPQESIKKLARWSQLALFAAGAGLLGYCAYVLADTWMYQRQASQLFELAKIPGPSVDAVNGMLGRMEIPRLGISLIVAEGTGEATLRRAGGHIPGTAFPGHTGNIGIAGHRDTLFRPLRNIRQDDLITLTTLQGEYRYRVVSTKIVSPSDMTVLNPDEHQVLTLVTCYPFYFVGPAPDRFIVRAERVGGST